MKAWRQGDVVLVESELPEDAVEIEHDGVLAHGEVTGHRHRITQGTVKFLHSTKGTFLDVISETALLEHEEHAPITLTRGVRRFFQQREFDWMSNPGTKVFREVAD